MVVRLFLCVYLLCTCGIHSANLTVVINWYFDYSANVTVVINWYFAYSANVTVVINCPLPRPLLI